MFFLNIVNRGENMTFTFINTRILPRGSTVVKTEDESIYLGSNINVAIFIFVNQGNYTFYGFTIDEMFEIKKNVFNLKKHKKNIEDHYTKTFAFKNVESMLVPHEVEFSINSDLNIFMKEIDEFFEIKKIDVCYKTDSMNLIGTKKVYGLVDNNCFRDYVYDKKYLINETLLFKQSAIVKIFDFEKNNNILDKQKRKIKNR